MTPAPLLALALLAAAPGADPQQAAPVCEARWTDPARTRQVPVRIRMPAGTARAPVVLFSHGLGGSLDAGTRWGEAWAGAGFVVVHLQHPGSDRSIVGSGGLLGAMNAQQLVARAQDVRFVLDELEKRTREGACDLARIDRARVGMSGHSFGAHTTLAVTGQRFPFAAGRGLADPRIGAAIAFSPAPPRAGGLPDAAAFGSIAVPFFSVTGTEDAVPVAPDITPADRERPFRAMPPGDKYLLVMAGANHAAFSGQDSLRSRGTPPEVHAAVARLTTLFWQATLGGDSAARQALAASGATLRPTDRFETR